MFQVILSGLILALWPPAGASPTAPLPASPSSSWEALAQEAPSDTAAAVWTLVREGSEARYRVQEQLAGFDFPNDAVGATQEISGAIAIAPDGTILPDQSEFRIQLTSLVSDNERRDGYVQRRTLVVQDYPEAVLKPRRFINLPHPLPESGPITFELEADLTLHGETQSTLWELTAEFGPDAITGFATTAFPFHTFGISIPQVARVLSVDDNIRLEMDFQMVREGDWRPFPAPPGPGDKEGARIP